MQYDELFSAYAGRLRPNAIRALSYLIARPGVLSFAGGVPSPETFPSREVSEIAARLVRERGHEVLQYGVTRGNRRLIEQVCEYMQARGVEATPAQVMLTSGSQQGLDLLCHTLIDPGDTVLVESPSYIGGLCSIRNAGARMIAIRMDDEGLDLDHLQSTISALRAGGSRIKFIYTIATFQNPSGITLSPERRRGLLELAARHNLLIVEDDPYSELYFTQSPPCSIKSLDEDGRVVYFGSFSKVLAPGLRTAWFVAPEQIAARMELAKESADLCSSQLDQAIVSECYSAGLLENRLPELREFYGVRCKAMLETIQEYAPEGTRWTRPTGGLFVWIEFEGGLGKRMKASTLLQEAVEREGIAFVPGLPFFIEERPDNTMRLAFSKESPERIRDGVRRLMGLIRNVAN